jgi:serine/threonine-protein kinase
MAEIWRARIVGVESFHKDVVIKTMRSELAQSEQLVRMFAFEANVAARFNHPGVVQIFDFGVLEGRHFIAMEHVPGRSLRQLGRVLRERHRRLSRVRVLRLVEHMARALAYGHTLVDGGRPLGFVHNDVSPENIMISASGAAKLIDFGAASTADSPVPSSELVGKLRYVAPERLRGAPGDQRVDVYALGVILYEYLTGAYPYAGSDLLRQIAEGRMPSPCAKVQGLPERVGAVVLRAMAIDPARRYPDATALADELAVLLRKSLGHDRLAASEEEVDELLQLAAAEEAEPTSSDERRGAARTGAPQLRVLKAVPPPLPESEAIEIEPELVESPSEPIDVALALDLAEPAPSGIGESGPTGIGESGPTAVFAGSAPFEIGEPGLSVSPSGEWRFGPRPAGSAPAADGESEERRDPDPFAVAFRPRAGKSPTAGWFGAADPDGAAPGTPPADGPQDPDPDTFAPTEAAAAAALAAAEFDRGLALVGERCFMQALSCWERAVTLAPARRSYRANFERLRRQLDAGQAQEIGSRA